MIVDDRIRAIATDRSTSYWLRDALISALERDPVDSANDAEYLAFILAMRARSHLTGNLDDIIDIARLT